jgi:aryl-alcohol dehydrogenase-like predicted oxidoreductase
MKSKKGFEEVLKTIMAGSELTEELETAINELRTFFDETNVILSKHGQVIDGEDSDYEYIENQVEESLTDFEAKYNELRQKYIDRFFGGNPDETKEDVFEEETPEEDSSEKTINDLFKEE